MTAQIITLANAVVTELNTPVGVTWSQTFTAARKYRIRREIKDVVGWLVSVVKADREVEIGDRSRVQRDMQVDIGIQRRVNPDVLAEADAVLDLAEEFEAYWLKRRPAAYSSAICWKVDTASLYIPEHLEQLGVATVVSRLTFRTFA